MRFFKSLAWPLRYVTIIGMNRNYRRRNSLRHQGWHYGAAGYYFVTICTAGRECVFDSDTLKTTVESVLRDLPSFKSASEIVLDEWIVMPNHIHLIIIILQGIAPDSPRPNKTISGTIGALVGTFKSTATRRINNLRRTPGAKLWQRGYHDRIIRNESQLNAIRAYIVANPERWAEDRDNLDALFDKMTYQP